MMRPDGPTKAARMQSSADEKAQISEVIRAESRMHQVSARPIAGIAVANATCRLKGKTHLMVTSVRLPSAKSLYLLVALASHEK
jgi:hypothetical protein